MIANPAEQMLLLSLFKLRNLIGCHVISFHTHIHFRLAYLFESVCLTSLMVNHHKECRMEIMAQLQNLINHPLIHKESTDWGYFLTFKHIPNFSFISFMNGKHVLS